MGCFLENSFLPWKAVQPSISHVCDVWCEITARSKPMSDCGWLFVHNQLCGLLSECHVKGFWTMTTSAKTYEHHCFHTRDCPLCMRDVWMCDIDIQQLICIHNTVDLPLSDNGFWVCCSLQLEVFFRFVTYMNEHLEEGRLYLFVNKSVCISPITSMGPAPWMCVCQKSHYSCPLASGSHHQASQWVWRVHATCSPHCHSVMHSHKRMAPVHNIPNCDVSGMVVVADVLSILWM